MGVMQLVRGKGINFYRGIMGGYDVRGLAMPRGGKQPNLSPEIMFHLGAALGSRLKPGQTVFVTRDARLTSPSFQDALVQGFIQTGVNVVQTLSPTPTGVATWFVTNQKERIAAGIVVSGSHNPKEDNGVKISIGGEALYGTALKEIIPVMEKGEYRVVSQEQFGKVSFEDATSQYLSMLEFAFPNLRLDGANILFDAGDGIGGVLVPFLASRGAEVETRNILPDGQYPAYGKADPSLPAITEAVSNAVRAISAASRKIWIGLMTDGDADRSGFITESGGVFWPDKIGAVLYRHYLEGLKAGRVSPHYGGHLALDVRASTSATEMIKALGGSGWFIPAGYPSHRTWARLLAHEIGKGLPTGISMEASGHFFYPTALIGADGRVNEALQDMLIDDGLFSALMLLQIQRETGQTLDGLMGLIPDFPSSREVRLAVADDSRKFDLVSEIKARLLARYASRLKPAGRGVTEVQGLKIQAPDEGVIEVDGIRLQLNDNSFGLLRPSNTSPMVTLRFEAREGRQLVALMDGFNETLTPNEGDIDLSGLREEISFQKKQFGII